MKRAEMKRNDLAIKLNPDGRGTKGITSVVAMDCEMVGVGDERESALARVSIVNFYGIVLLDCYVSPPDTVTDYRTETSGIRPEDLEGPNVKSLREAQNETYRILKKRVVVGHSLRNDFSALMIRHPRNLVRDTASFPPFRRLKPNVSSNGGGACIVMGEAGSWRKRDGVWSTRGVRA